jgi:SNF2 family DNA or RNA helicase
MSTQQTNTSKQISDYQALSSTQKTVVRIMAVNVGYCRLHAMISCLSDLGRVNEKTGKAFTAASIQPLQKELIEKELLLKSSKGICCPESVQQQAVYDALMEDEFPGIAKGIEKYMSLHNAYTPADTPTYPPNFRSLRIAIFTHNSMETIDFIAGDEWHNLFQLILNTPFSPEIIDKIAPEIRFEILGVLLKAAESSLEPAEEIVSYFSNNFHAEQWDTSHLLPLIFHSLICGNTVTARSLLESLDNELKPEQLSRIGWLEFICGNYQEALSHFNNNRKLLKKRKGKRKVFLQSHAGLFHLLSLLHSGDHKYLQEALESIATARKNDYTLLPLLELMEPVFRDQLGLPVHELFVPGLYSFKPEPLELLIINLVLSWIDKAKVRNTIPLLAWTRDKALQNGYGWLAAEFSALLASLGQDREQNTRLATKLHKSCNTVSCVNIVKKQPKWEKTLNALLTITDRENRSTQETAEQRLIWLFSHNEQYNYCHIVPRLQKMSKKGNWTKGRPVALKTLYHDHHSMEGLSDQDRQVCRAIKEEYYRTGRRYGKTEYNLDANLALPALVDHPLLFLEHSPDVRVELVLSEAEIHITKEKGKLQLRIFPATSGPENEVQVVQDTPTRFKIIRFSKKQNSIIELLGKGMTIPKSGEKLVKQVVDSLSTVVTVHSDLATAGKTKSVQADSRPHAHLLPYKDGVQLEFLVKPFSAGGSSFRPGKGGKNVLTEMEGTKVQAVRNFAREKKQQREIIKSCLTLHRLEEVENLWQVEDPEDALELLLELKECGDDVILEWPRGEKMAVRREVSFSQFSMQIKRDRDWFKATGTLQIDDALSLDLRNLLDMLSRATGRFIPLDDGTFLTITRQLRKRLDELQAFSQNHGKGLRFAPLAALALADLTDEAGQLKSDKAWKEHCTHLNEVVSPQIPSTLQASLRDYQKIGFHWLAQLSHWQVGGCLADDMGLGKTVQALAAILLRAGQGPTLVVAPLSVTSNWQDESRRFAPTLRVILFGPGDRQKTIDHLEPFDLLIVSYGLLPLEAELLSGVKWQTIVLDEAQAIKNIQTKRSKAAMELQAEFRIITTGTPVENHLGELWTLFHFLNPGLLGSYKKFNEKFAIPIERDQDTEARNRLRKLIRPFILRRLKSDVLQELPAKTEITLEVEMNREELLLYEAGRLKALENISAHDEEGAGQQHLRILAEIMKLRRLCCNPKLVLPDSKIESSKLKVFGDTLTELLANNHKALIFSQFVGHLHILRDYLDQHGISYQYLDGSTPIKKRKERINSFQNGEGDVFLISLKAGGAGLNLTAADYVIHMDPWWNPAVEDQASDRAHRIGQERPVTVYRLVVKNSIEEQIVDLHKQKRDLADSLLEGTDSAGKISAAELLGLLQRCDDK